MPRFDGTGPEGAGRFTGWGEGDCTDADVEDVTQYANTSIRRRPLRRRLYFSRRRWSRFGRRGRGRGTGRGRR